MPASAAEHNPLIRHLDKGKLFYCAGQYGHAWQVLNGAIRLNTYESEEPSFAGLAVAGDVIGAETLLRGYYDFEASALSFCLIKPWYPQNEHELLSMCAAAAQRTATLLALRSGSAEERVHRLIDLLARGQGPYADTASICLPSLRNIGEITGLTFETVSRVFSRWRSLGYTVASRTQGGLRLAWPIHPAAVAATQQRNAS